MDKREAILVVDVQNDFVEGGSLGVRGGRAVIPKINEFVRSAGIESVVIFTMDWHPPDHSQFKINGGIWPVHCVQGTNGAELVQELEIPTGAQFVRKGMHRDADGYSAFESTDKRGRLLPQILSEHGVSKIKICGLTTEYCVRSTALDAVAAGYEVEVKSELVAGVNESDARAVLDELKTMGVSVR